jgi:hypothetical protein
VVLALKERPILLWISDIATVVYCTGQALWSYHLTEGQKLSSYLTFWLFTLLGLWLASIDCSKKDTLKARETRWTYRLWVIGSGLDLALLLYLKVVKGYQIWLPIDTLNLSLAFGSAALMVTIGLVIGRKTIFNDPFVKGWVAVALKSLPQFVLAGMMLFIPKASPHWAAIIAGLITIAIRLKVLHSTARKERWTPERRGLQIAEWFNLISWTCVAIVAVGWAIWSLLHR